MRQSAPRRFQISKLTMGSNTRAIVFASIGKSMSGYFEIGEGRGDGGVEIVEEEFARDGDPDGCGAAGRTTAPDINCASSTVRVRKPT